MLPAPMLDLRSLDPDRQSADRPVAMLVAWLLLAAAVFGAVLGGRPGAIWIGGLVAVAGMPWLLAFRGRAALPADAADGVPFALRGERVGVWALAPLAGSLLMLPLAGLLGVDSVLLRLALCAAGAVAYTWLLARAERAYEAAIHLVGP